MNGYRGPKRCECGQYPDVCARYGHRDRPGDDEPQSVKRGTVSTKITMEWHGIAWDDLTPECREFVRERVDAICDRLDIEAH